jgi:hypothetical protein
MTAGCFEPPKELYDKFDEFLALLLELNPIRDTLYNPISQRIAATLNTMSEQGGFELRNDNARFWVSLRFDEDDFNKVLERSISFQWGYGLEQGTQRAIETLEGFCAELRAAKVPEPEVLIVEETPKGTIYKISREWLNWFRTVLPHYPPEAEFEMAGLQAAKKHFQEGPEDRIERSFSPIYNRRTDDIEIEFYRVTRVKL